MRSAGVPVLGNSYGIWDIQLTTYPNLCVRQFSIGIFLKILIDFVVKAK